MISSNGITNAATYYQKNMPSAKKSDLVAKEKLLAAEEKKVNASEDKLSAKAKEYLDSLRKTYGDYEFLVADAGDDKRALLNKSNKEFSVIFSSSELEKMANDEDYAKEKLHAVQTAVTMSKKICEQFGYERNGRNDGGKINKIAISINEDGTLSIFAELEKVSQKQKDYIEKIKEKRADEKKEAEELAQKKAKDKNVTVKKVTVEASSQEELVEKITNVDWDKVAGENLGARFDFSV